MFPRLPLRAAFAGRFPPLMNAQAKRDKHSVRADPPTLPAVSQPDVTPTSATSARARNSALRVRQHVNPLASHYQRPVDLPPNWYDAAFPALSQPLTIDVGVARGRWIYKMAKLYPERNFLGLEIRAGLVSSANAVRDRDKLTNLHYLYANANVDFRNITRGIPVGLIDLICFQFSDPWFKARHAKRRLVQEPLVRDVAAALLSSRGRCYIASDVAVLASEMRERFDACSSFERDTSHAWTPDGWLPENPFGVPTEREIAVMKDPFTAVYRAMFQIRPAEPSSNVQSC